MQKHKKSENKQITILKKIKTIFTNKHKIIIITKQSTINITIPQKITIITKIKTFIKNLKKLVLHLFSTFHSIIQPSNKKILF